MKKNFIEAMESVKRLNGIAIDIKELINLLTYMHEVMNDHAESCPEFMEVLKEGKKL